MQVVHAQLLAFQRYPIPTAFGGVKGLGVPTASRERLQNVIPESPFFYAPWIKWTSDASCRRNIFQFVVRDYELPTL